MTDYPYEDEERPPFTPARAALWMLGALIILLSAVLLVLAFNPRADRDQVTLGAVSAVAFFLVSALLIGRYPAGPHLSQALGFRRTHILAWPLGALAGVLAQIPAQALSRSFDKLFPSPPEQLAAQLALFQTESVSHSVAIFGVLCLLIPLAEESFFRGAVYGAMRRSSCSGALAATVVGVGFTLCHVQARLFLPLALFSAVLGILRATSGSLWPALLAHVAFNSVTMAGYLTSFELPQLKLAQTLVGTFALGALLLFFARLVRNHSASCESREEETYQPPLDLPL